MQYQYDNKGYLSLIFHAVFQAKRRFTPVTVIHVSEIYLNIEIYEASNLPFWYNVLLGFINFITSEKYH